MSTTEGLEAPLVTILVPCYQYGRYLRNCLEGIFAQTIIDQISVEIIVINDASTDNTDAVMREFTDPRIHYIRHDRNRGLCYTLSEGLTLARGKYFTRIDADDRWKPHFLEVTLPELERYPDVALVFGDVAHVDEQGNIINEESTIARSLEVHGDRDFKGDRFLSQVGECTIGTAGVIGRTEAWRKGLPFPKCFTWESPSDWWLNIMAIRDADVYYKKGILGEYRMHSASMTHQQGSVDAVDIEQTTIGAINEAFSGVNLKREHRLARRMIYANAWTTLGNINFEKNRGKDSRRCYANAVLWRPDYVLRKSIARHFLSSLLPRKLYEKIKKGVKKMF
ncbi:MAG: alpha-1,6-rhamnosyltransferase [Parcubacteria bacterium C7867-006]|nr:MAG: alpha-1,6-rhamnosyltransferase [Parcubacteria bacterium C7867-006]